MICVYHLWCAPDPRRTLPVRGSAREHARTKSEIRRREYGANPELIVLTLRGGRVACWHWPERTFGASDLGAAELWHAGRRDVVFGSVGACSSTTRRPLHALTNTN